MSTRTRAGVWLALLWVALLQACREEEQNRPLVYDKGAYQGQQDEPLSPAQVDELHHRANRQRF